MGVVDRAHCRMQRRRWPSRLLKNSKILRSRSFYMKNTKHQLQRQDVQKGPLACAKPLSAFVATSAKEARRSQVQHGRRAVGGRSVHGVREYDNGPRTPLADFFNILLEPNPDTRIERDGTLPSNPQTLSAPPPSCVRVGQGPASPLNP